MGISTIGRLSACGHDTKESKVVVVYKDKQALPNPNKFRWKILNFYPFPNKWCVVVVRYLDCTNYEGKKVLVYDNRYKFNKLVASKILDPHFSNDDYSPIARFVPTGDGIRLAKNFARAQAKEK